MTMKLVKTATALALGASLISTAVVSTDASAASKYKISKGKLVIAKTGKVAKGYVTYKSLVYKDGKKLTGLKGKTYYKAGKKGTGTYKGAYYYKGAKKITTGTYKGAYYYKGVKKVTTGLYNGRYYKSGVKATGTYKGAYYVKGTKKVTTGVYNNAYYVKGYKKVTTGVYNGAYYVKGVKKVTTGYYAGFHYVAGVKIIDNGFYGKTLYINGKANTGLVLFEEKLFDGSALNKEVALFEEKLFDGAELNKGYKLYKEDLYNNEKLNVGQVEFEGKLYQDAKLSKGLVTFVGEDKKELVYNDGELANGTFTVDGKEVTYKDGVKLPFNVLSVTSISTTTVEVAISELTEDVFGATVEVKDSKGNVREVEVVPAIAKGKKVGKFTFKPAVEAKDLVGVWTVNGVEFDFVAPAKFKAIIEATDTVSLNDALLAADIKNVKAANVAEYKTAIADALKLEEAKKPKNLADIQAIVEQVNAKAVEEIGKEALAKAVNDAGNDPLLVLKALDNGFDRVNKDWINAYVLELNTTPKVEKDYKAIQDAVDKVNTAEITTLANGISTADKEKLATIKSTIVKFGGVDEKGELNAANKVHLKSIEDRIKEIDKGAVVAEEAKLVEAVQKALTPTKFKEAVTNLAVFVNDKQKLDITTYVDANEKAYFDARGTVTDVASVKKLITDKNNDAKEAAAIAPFKAIVEAAKSVKTDEEKAKFIATLKAAGVKEVATDKANEAAYVAAATTISASAAKATTLATVEVALKEVQAAVTTANVEVVKAAAVEAEKEASTVTETNALLASLAVIGTKNVKAENVKGYAVELAKQESLTVETAQKAIEDVNAGATTQAAVKAINEATTATAVKAGLDTLVNNKEVADYLTVVSADHIFIAEQVLAARPEAKYVDVTAVTEAVKKAVEARTTLITNVNAVDTTNLQAVVTVLTKVDASAFTGTALQNNLIAEKFIANKKADYKFQTISEIRTAIAAAVAAK